jgi:hypothetical protein
VVTVGGNKRPPVTARAVTGGWAALALWSAILWAVYLDSGARVLPDGLVRFGPGLSLPVFTACAALSVVLAVMPVRHDGHDDEPRPRDEGR